MEYFYNMYPIKLENIKEMDKFTKFKPRRDQQTLWWFD